MKNTIFRGIFIVSLLVSIQAHSQTLAPEVQFWVDSIQRYISVSVEKNMPVDTGQLAKLNAKAQHARDSIGLTKTKNQGPSNGKQSKIITKSAMAGSSLTVPPNTIWKVKDIFVKNDRDPYRLKVTSLNCDVIYKAGEKINLPIVSAEAALIDEGGGELTYDLEIEEIKLE